MLRSLQLMLRYLQFDVDAAEINKNVKTDASVIGDALEVLKRVNAKLEQADRHEWVNHINELKKKYPMTYNRDCLNGPLVMEKSMISQRARLLYQQM